MRIYLSVSLYITALDLLLIYFAIKKKQIFAENKINQECKIKEIIYFFYKFKFPNLIKC